MSSDLAPHLDIALRHGQAGTTVTAIPRLQLSVGLTSHGKTPCLYQSMICFILQGSKHVAINNSLLSYDSAQYLISALDLPLIGEIFNGEAGQPYVAVSLVIEPSLLADMASALPAVRESDAQYGGISINPTSAPIRETLLRLLALLDTPGDIAALGPMIERELLYRLLQGPQGKLLRQIAQPEGALGRIRRAVAWIRDNYNRQLRIEVISEACGMSRASLHRHFLSMTGMSPLQYQKQLRLQEARKLLLSGEHSVAYVAFEVGYESASQFGREYLRQFGAPPARDARRTRQLMISPAAMQPA